MGSLNRLVECPVNFCVKHHQYNLKFLGKEEHCVNSRKAVRGGCWIQFQGASLFILLTSQGISSFKFFSVLSAFDLFLVHAPKASILSWTVQMSCSMKQNLYLLVLVMTQN